ncbi:MAG: hypothetical protein N2204_02900, partial [Anaerolineae bacterium]|nr:hypothetical protein [Anaerolineae bacterium]
MTTILTAANHAARPPGVRRIRRQIKDQAARSLFLLFTALPLCLVLLMIAALVGRTRPILTVAPPWQLLTGQTWRPFQGEFGFYPFIIGTLWVTVIAMLLAVPPSLLAAIYLAEYARSSTRALMKP